jgi:hypothetical protein
MNKYTLINYEVIFKNNDPNGILPVHNNYIRIKLRKKELNTYRNKFVKIKCGNYIEYRLVKFTNIGNGNIVYIDYDLKTDLGLTENKGELEISRLNLAERIFLAPISSSERGLRNYLWLSIIISIVSLILSIYR